MHCIASDADGLHLWLVVSRRRSLARRERPLAADADRVVFRRKRALGRARASSAERRRWGRRTRPDRRMRAPVRIRPRLAPTMTIGRSLAANRVWTVATMADATPRARSWLTTVEILAPSSVARLSRSVEGVVSRNSSATTFRASCPRQRPRSTRARRNPSSSAFPRAVQTTRAHVRRNAHLRCLLRNLG